MQLPRVSRRNLLIGGGAGAGLVIAFLAWPRQEGSPLRSGPSDKVIGPYLRVANDGQVTLAVPQAEVGQGIWTGLAQIAADELGAAWETMAVEPAPSAAAFTNTLIAEDYGVATRVTAGSSSIRAFEKPIREAAAAARIMLCEAAAVLSFTRASDCALRSWRTQQRQGRFQRRDYVPPAAARSPGKPSLASTCPPSRTEVCASLPTFVCPG
jgi:isoquinoline 1-oxidoreductase beta subunit